jgi:hypothetical protein
MKSAWNIINLLALFYIFYLCISDSRQKGYIAGCEDTRAFAVEVIKAWESAK